MAGSESLQTQGATVINLPPGVRVGPGRETSQLNELGELAQGMVFPVTAPNGSRATVFIPYTRIEDADYVTKAIEARVRAITAIVTT